MATGARFTAKDLAIIGAALGTADFLLEGRLSAPAARALKRYVLPQAARTVPRLGSTALQVGKTIAVRHPVLTAGAIAYYTYQNREEIGNLVEQGYEVIRPAVQSTLEFAGDVNPGFENVPVKRMTKRKKSTFNKAVSAGLKALKGSTSYGKKGVLSNAKAAFKTATKAASARSKGKKMPNAGPAKVAYKAAKGVYTDEILRRKMK